MGELIYSTAGIRDSAAIKQIDDHLAARCCGQVSLVHFQRLIHLVADRFNRIECS
jgi:hypothetical protein